MFARSAVAVALLASFAAAQTNATIDPNSVDLSTRGSWCTGQLNTCGTLCSGNDATNDCDPGTLIYHCTCAANNSAPGLQYYQITIPTFICEKIYANCIAANANNKAGQDRCTETRKANCGTLNPENFTATPATTSSTQSATLTSTTASGASVTGTSSSRALAVPTGASYGTGVLAAGVAAAFGLLL